MNWRDDLDNFAGWGNGPPRREWVGTAIGCLFWVVVLAALVAVFVFS